MSNLAVRRLLIKVKKELEKDAKFRSASNRKTHKFTMSKEQVKNQALQQINKKGYILDDKVKKIIETNAEKIFKAAHEYFSNAKDKAADPEAITITESGTGFSVVLKTKIKDDNKAKTIFDSVKNSYRNEVKQLVEELNNHYLELGEEPIPTDDSNSFLDLGHKRGSEIARQTRKGSQRLLVEQFAKSTRVRNQITAKEAKALGLKLSIIKRDSKELDEIKVELEAQTPNRSKGATTENKIKDVWREALENALEKLAQQPDNFGGSDTRPTKEKKRIQKAFDDKISKNSKNIKLKSNNTKINKSKGKKQSTSVGPKKYKKGRTATAAVSLKGVKPKKRSTARSTISLKALLQQRLVEIVSKNMGKPALVYRTGRFARSVKITDIAITGKGFPSIGYTYMKYPYQTFEPGFKQGSIERDPRKLIDRSIREIAAELTIGRFYTRRV